MHILLTAVYSNTFIVSIILRRKFLKSKYFVPHRFSLHLLWSHFKFSVSPRVFSVFYLVPSVDCISGRLVYYHVWKEISKRATRLIRKMLRVNISQRLVAAEAIRDPWFDDPIVEKAKELVRSYAVSFCAQVIEENWFHKILAVCKKYIWSPLGRRPFIRAKFLA